MYVSKFGKNDKSLLNLSLYFMYSNDFYVAKFF